jgi:hypothetical protein
VGCRVLVQLAGDGDEVTDATAVWPETREEVEFGTLILTARVDELAPEMRTGPAGPRSVTRRSMLRPRKEVPCNRLPGIIRHGLHPGSGVPCRGRRAVPSRPVIGGLKCRACARYRWLAPAVLSNWSSARSASRLNDIDLV